MTLAPDGLAQLVSAALPDEGLTSADLDTCCYGPDTEIIGDGDAAAVLSVKGSGGLAAAWIVLLVVHPDRRREGRGRALVDESATRARAAGAIDLHLGTAIPRYVWPGVDFHFNAALALFELITAGHVVRLTTAVLAVGLLLCGLLSLTAGLILHSIARRSQEFEYHMQLIADEMRAGRDLSLKSDGEDGRRFADSEHDGRSV